MLAAETGDRRFVLPLGGVLLVGRDAASQLPILDRAVSRLHAEVTPFADHLELQDLGSRNGTWVNGRRITRSAAMPGDTVAFGTVLFTVRREEEAVAVAPALVALDGSATLLHERVVPSRAGAMAALTGAGRDGDGTATAARLAQLVDIAHRLGGFSSRDALLESITSDLFRAFDADRVTILLPAEDGTLETRVSRDRHGHIPRPVPRVIVNGVADRQVALLTSDARADVRTAGASVQQQAVKSAMAAPLLDESRATIGVLYVDHLRDRAVYAEDDLAFLVAFASIAAVAVEREAAAARLRQATRVRENFERYFSPHIAERIARSTSAVVPGGDRQRVIVLFSDLRGFTTIAESLPPMAMAAQLNEYFAAMVACVFRHDGALDKFIGDALMAYWGAPEPQEDDAHRALTAALEMQHALDALNSRWALEGRPLLSAGIGIHAGEAFAGNIGAPSRLEYTLIGDTVNVANRLCGLARGGEVLISDSVVALCTQPWHYTPRPDLDVVRHHATPQAVWQVSAP